jgi:hypothetical protein
MIEQHRFEKELFGIEQRISRRVLEDMPGWQLESYIDDFCQDLVIRATTKMPHGDKEVKESFQFPLTWWDHLKHTINNWAWGHTIGQHLFFNNIAKAIIALKITPRYKSTPVFTQVIKNYCPHLAGGDNRPHIDFMLQKPLRWEELYHGE